MFFFGNFTSTGFGLGVETLNGVTRDQLNALNPAIVHYIGHLHVATAGYLEPSLGLTPMLVEQLFAMVQAINGSGTTVFLVEQNARKTLEIAHHGFLLQKGEIVGRGTAAELSASEIVRHAYLRA